MILKDEAVLNHARNRDRCEFCGISSYRLFACHILTRGAGQVDLPENLCSFCGICAPKDQDQGGPISKLVMKIIAGNRECLLAFCSGGDNGPDWSDIEENCFAVRRLPKRSLR
jgi:hypothetical protein